MDYLNSYQFIILASSIVILSYFYNLIGKRTSVPAVLLLIATGIIIRQVMLWLDVPRKSFLPQLEVLGIIGLIMIVLEAALDLELKREKWPILWRSFGAALLGLVGSVIALAFVFRFFFDADNAVCMLYAVPLSIISSAIVIPSVSNLNRKKAEFMIYESTFSDILGIMLFYFLVSWIHPTSGQNPVINFTFKTLLTLASSLFISIILVIVFQKVRTHGKMFLLIALLLLLYAIGKLMHMSSLVMILVFGMVLKNERLFFRGFLKNWIDVERLHQIREDFHTVTSETSFIVRTFFFVIFGISISLITLLDIKVFIISILCLGIMFGIRFVVLKMLDRGEVAPKLYIAPRGLITILLFFAISAELPANKQINSFDPGILLFIILITSIVMMIALMREGKKDLFDHLFHNSSAGETAISGDNHPDEASGAKDETREGSASTD